MLRALVRRQLLTRSTPILLARARPVRLPAVPGAGGCYETMARRSGRRGISPRPSYLEQQCVGRRAGARRDRRRPTTSRHSSSIRTLPMLARSGRRPSPCSTRAGERARGPRRTESAQRYFEQALSSLTAPCARPSSTSAQARWPCLRRVTTGRARCTSSGQLRDSTGLGLPHPAAARQVSARAADLAAGG